MDKIEININGYLQIPKGYHLISTSSGSFKLVKDKPKFKKWDIITDKGYIYVVDHIDNFGEIHYMLAVPLIGIGLHINSKTSIDPDRCEFVTNKETIHLVKTILRFLENKDIIK